MYFTKLGSVDRLLWQHRLSIRKVENGIYNQEIADICDKTFIEMFLENSCINHIFLAHCSFVLVAMGAVMQKVEKKNTLKNNSSDTICSMKLRLYRNIHHISLYNVLCVCVCVFFMKISSVFNLVVMATRSFHTLIMGRIEKGLYCQASLQVF